MPRHPVYPRIASLFRLTRRALPAERRKRLRQLLFEWLDLTWTLPSGIRVVVATYGDWIIYNEIFVSGEYDAAIDLAIARAATPMQIVDLGANVGFFTLRAAHRLRSLGVASWAVTAVEAEPAFVAEYRARVMESNGISSVRLIQGRLPEVDLGLSNVETIDLLKCDIEGAELAFIERHADVLSRTRVGVFELHADRCDVEDCKRLLAEAGFRGRVLRVGDPCSTYLAWRP
jgi:hypothetical protein